MSHPSVSVVVPTRNEGSNVVDTVAAVLRNTAVPMEVVVVDDGSEDGSPTALRELGTNDARLRLVEAGGVGLARAKNRGAREARGRYLAFLDAHCFTPAGWLEPVLELLESSPEVGVAGPAIADTDNVQLRGCGGTWRDGWLDMSWLSGAEEPREVPFQPGGCQVIRRELFEELGGYDEGLLRWGSEDVELCLRVWLFGHSIQVEPRATIYHHFRTAPPYSVEMRQVVYNKLRMSVLHFDGALLERVLERQLTYPQAPTALARLFSDGTLERGRVLRGRRVRDMDWFCERFGILGAAA